MAGADLAGGKELGIRKRGLLCHALVEGPEKT